MAVMDEPPEDALPLPDRDDGDEAEAAEVAAAMEGVDDFDALDLGQALLYLLDLEAAVEIEAAAREEEEWEELFGPELGSIAEPEPPDEAGALVPAAHPEEAAVVVYDPPAVPPPPRPPPGPPGPPRRRRCAERQVRDSWSQFSFIPKPAQGRFGAWEATCPYHRGTESAPKCKKTINMTNASGDEAVKVHKLLQVWCLHSKHYTRKHKHLKWDRHPSDEELAAISLDDIEVEKRRLPPVPPWETVLPDAVLDTMQAEEEVGVGDAAAAAPIPLADLDSATAASSGGG